MAWIEGTANGETLTGTADSDVIYGKGGNDTIDGAAGADSIYVGGFGDAVVHGGDGNDMFSADSYLNAGPQFLSFYGDNGNDYIFLNDSSYGSIHYTVFGGDGDDSFIGQGAYGAVIDAGSGNDFLALREGSYSAVLGEGHDSVSINSAYQSQVVTVRDFQASGASSDRLLFGRYLDYAVSAYVGVDWDPAQNPFADGHARLVQSGGDTLLQIDLDAGASANVFFTLAVLENVVATSLTAIALEGYDPLSSAVVGATFEGTADDDHLVGGAGADILNGGAGNDTLDGGYGADVVHGGLGSDTIADESGGSDQIFGDDGDDYIRVDRSNTSAGNVTVDGGAGNDRLSFTSSRVLGNSGAVVLLGGDGDDSIDIGAGYLGLYNTYGATANGGAGSDRITSGGGNDILIGGDNPSTSGPRVGYALLGDTLSYSSTIGGVVVDLAITAQQDTVSAGRDTISGFENLVGTQDSDVLSGNDVDNIIYGSTGNDIVSGRAGRDMLYGDAGDDVLEGGAGADYLMGGAGSDLASYAPSSAAVTLNFATNQHTGDALGDTFFLVERFSLTAFNDQYVGNQAADLVFGGAGNDRLEGGGGADWLDGGTGQDVLIGGTGDDSYVLDSPQDVIQELKSEGVDTVLARFNYELHVNVEIAKADTGFDVNLFGRNDQNDKLLGNERANYLGGLAGDDDLFGDAGNDSLDGGSGNDWLNGGDGDDVVYGGTGNDGLAGGSGKDWLDGAAGADNMYGGLDDDVYLVDNASDQAIEEANAGTDTVISTLNFELHGNIEILRLAGAAANGFGSDYDEKLYGNASANYLGGLGGRDFIYAGDGNDAVDGGAGDDWLDGEAGDDTLAGSAGSDGLEGGAGNDWMDGGAGLDVLYGGKGNDTLIGGADHDQFVFAPGDGADRILDFVAGGGEDAINLQAYVTGGITWAITQVGANTAITMTNGDSITLYDVHATDLVAQGGWIF